MKSRYADFGPTLAAEHLGEEDGLCVHAETLRRWMREAGLWRRARRRQPYRQGRERNAHFGELVQLDGSFHEWLEERGRRGCLGFRASLPISRPDAFGLPIAQLQQLPGFSQPQAARLHSSHHFAPTQLLTAQLASPQSESLLAGGTLNGDISNVVSRGHFNVVQRAAEGPR